MSWTDAAAHDVHDRRPLHGQPESLKVAAVVASAHPARGKGKAPITEDVPVARTRRVLPVCVRHLCRGRPARPTRPQFNPDAINIKRLELGAGPEQGQDEQGSAY